ncbi:LOW QUALITY PROTEIN: N-acetyllactosaminide beta-1,3-N-acetylglucosaminyltransferase 3 [Dasypus novemcinctus]|uniref:LOW QUALITY PROTEIN: N-acetyllactosaminide beta-1,3-N-acetylglucosaminyltransferase 3 n=1 Tax=Dasypus novemcinctus TaxID=9361 RepID=UPI00265F4E0E|nr:LOW QUALITY PROTEIN: N-acetyllactosaminide beta-1,3-N-acetylglucosaminyltransferase 3 [Dasypus novemcinctus]
MRGQRARAGLCALGAAALLFLAGLRVAPPACPRPAPTEPPEPPAPSAAPPAPPAPPAARCGANASAAEQPGFAELPRRVRDFLRFRHCRRFALLQDAPRAKCAPPPFLLLAVKSAPRHLERRELVRRTWGRERQVRGAQLRRLFLVGTAAEPREARKVNRLLALEARAHGDVLQWDFHDTFFNLSLKQVLFLEWQQARCPNASFLLSGDDDVFAHTDNMVAYLQDHQPDRHLFVGHLILNVGPVRSPESKYYVPQAVTRAERYPPYCGGGGLLLSRFTLAAVARAARALDVFPIDDVFLGMCLEHAGLRPASHAGIRTAGVRAPAERESSFDPCFYRELLLVHRFLPYEMLLMWEALSRPRLACGKQVRVY